MGSPLAPVLANLFLGHHENIWLNKYQGPSRQFYRRYVDDTFCLFNNEQDALVFFDFLNSQHPNIKLTMEKESNKMLAFLDVCISNKDPCNLLTSVYRKSTFTGLLTNFYSFTSYSSKIGLIRALVDRAYKISNTLAKFNDDVKKLFGIFKKYQYPECLISRVVHSYLDIFIVLIILNQLLILLPFILSCHSLSFLILPSVRYVCLLKSIAIILILN